MSVLSCLKVASNLPSFPATVKGLLKERPFMGLVLARRRDATVLGTSGVGPVFFATCLAEDGAAAHVKSLRKVAWRPHRSVRPQGAQTPAHGLPRPDGLADRRLGLALADTPQMAPPSRDGLYTTAVGRLPVTSIVRPWVVGDHMAVAVDGGPRRRPPVVPDRRRPMARIVVGPPPAPETGRPTLPRPRQTVVTMSCPLGRRLVDGPPVPSRVAGRFGGRGWAAFVLAEEGHDAPVGPRHLGPLGVGDVVVVRPRPPAPS